MGKPISRRGRRSEPDVIEIPGMIQESVTMLASGARIIVLNPRGDSEVPFRRLDGRGLSPWDVLHLRWRLRERLNQWRDESSEILSQFERASKQAAVAYLKTFGPVSVKKPPVMFCQTSWPGRVVPVSLGSS